MFIGNLPHWMGYSPHRCITSLGGPKVELGSSGPFVWDALLITPEDRCQARPCPFPDVRTGGAVCKTVY